MSSVIMICMLTSMNNSMLNRMIKSEEGDSTKMTLKAKELGVYIVDDLNQTKQAEE